MYFLKYFEKKINKQKYRFCPPQFKILPYSILNKKISEMCLKKIKWNKFYP